MGGGLRKLREELEAENVGVQVPERRNTITIRWTPAHLGIKGNEQADTLAKRAAEGRKDRAGPSFILEAILSHLTRKVTEARSNATSRWIREYSGRRRRYRPPKAER